MQLVEVIISHSIFKLSSSSTNSSITRPKKYNEYRSLRWGESSLHTKRMRECITRKTITCNYTVQRESVLR
jgi:hypothetical protein